MKIVVDEHPLISAVVATSVVAMFVAGGMWLAIFALRNRRSTIRWAGVPGTVVGLGGAAMWLLFAVLWWRAWSPWEVELTDNAVELRYLFFSERIELPELQRVEFELVKQSRGRERSIVRLFSGGRRHEIVQEPEPPGDLRLRPVRQFFDQLTAKLPADKVQDTARS